MPGSSRELLKAGLALKAAHVRRAAAGYFRNRADQAAGTASAYAIAAACWSAAAFFIILTLLAGLAALFRWVQLNFGEFQAFGAVAGVTTGLTLICAITATLSLKKKSKPIPSLPSRLRVAVASPPIPRTMISQAARETVFAAADGVRRNSPMMGFLIGATALSGFVMGRRLLSVRQEAATKFQGTAVDAASYPLEGRRMRNER